MQLVFDLLERRVSPGETVRFPLALRNEAAEPVECTFQLHVEEPGFVAAWCRLPAPASLAGGAWERDELSVQLPQEGAVEPGTYHLWLTAHTTDGVSTAGAGCTLVVETKLCARFSAVPQFTLNPDGTVTVSLNILNCGNVQIDGSVRLRHEDGWRFERQDPELTLQTGLGPVEVEFTYRPADGRRASAEDEVTVEIRSEGLVLARASGRVQSPTKLLAGGRSRWRWIWVAPLVLILGALSLWTLPQLISALSSGESLPAPSPGPGLPPPGPGLPPPSPQPLPVADLSISDLTGKGITIENKGDGSAGPFYIHVVYSGNEDRPGEEMILYSDGLAPGASIYEKTWEGCLRGSFVAQVDVYNSVVESNEDNNGDSFDEDCSIE